MATNQSDFEDIVKILRSLRSVKGVVIQVKSELLGVEWARSSDCPQAKYNGVIAGWKRTGEELYVKWPGYSKNKAVRFEVLENDSNGDSLELALQPYEDGSPPPELYVPPLSIPTSPDFAPTFPEFGIESSKPPRLRQSMRLEHSRPTE
mmetsp:Transcript_15570/g.39076  ORF Transcript_15570/g.39076 Transcript_15570/m.39076 type:complete len:149 (-) Transcript_15570:659-1105(-)